MSAYHEIREIISCVKGLRQTAEATFHSCFEQATDLATAAEVCLETPSQCRRQTLHDNPPADTPEQYFRRSVGIPFLDFLLSQLETRFSQAEVAADGLKLVPATLLLSAQQGFNAVPADICSLAKLWEDDLPDSHDLPAE